MEELLKKLYPEAKKLFEVHDYKLNEDYSFSDGHKEYKPYYYNNDKLIITYYGDGFEVIGEMIIDENQISLEFKKNTLCN